jgi:septum formation protein
MLRALSGKTHEVVTGICVIDARTGKKRSGMELSEVTFKQLSETDIHAYVDTGEPMDKAGAYAIQGGAAGFITALKGPMDNVMGFPMDLFLKLIGEMED